MVPSQLRETRKLEIEVPPTRQRIDALLGARCPYCRPAPPPANARQCVPQQSLTRGGDERKVMTRSVRSAEAGRSRGGSCPASPLCLRSRSLHATTAQKGCRPPPSVPALCPLSAPPRLRPRQQSKGQQLRSSCGHARPEPAASAAAVPPLATPRTNRHWPS